MTIDSCLLVYSEFDSKKKKKKKKISAQMHEKLLPLAECQHCPSLKHFPNDLYIILATSWWGRHYFPTLQIAELGRESVRKPPWASRQGRSGQKKALFPPLQLLLLPEGVAVTLGLLLLSCTWEKVEGYEKPDPHLPSAGAIAELMCRWRPAKEVHSTVMICSFLQVTI